MTIYLGRIFRWMGSRTPPRAQAARDEAANQVAVPELCAVNRPGHSNERPPQQCLAKPGGIPVPGCM